MLTINMDINTNMACHTGWSGPSGATHQHV
jgi:hypothetical protein